MMPKQAIKQLMERFYASTNFQFWVLQLVYWFGVCVVTFFTLTLWYGHYGWVHASHTLFQGMLGAALALPLRNYYEHIWNKPLVARAFLSLLALIIVSLVWTVVRMQTFIWITQEDNVWPDFGGWYFGAIFIFLGWGALYHGTRYFQLLQAEHSMMLQAEAVSSREQLKRLQAEAVARDAQLKMLRYQLNPHFLFNTLNAINALVQMQEMSKAQRMIVQLSQFLRYSLDNNPDMKIPLESEVQALMLYLEIEKTRFGERLQLDFEVSSEASTALVPSLLIQPIIENSLKYAIAKSEKGGVLKLRARIEDNKLVLELSDTGSNQKITGSKLKSENGRGIGLRNIIDRLKTLYGQDYEYQLSYVPSGGLHTRIVIPHELEASANRIEA